VSFQETAANALRDGSARTNELLRRVDQASLGCRLSGRRRIELRAERESLLQVLDEDAHLGGHAATGRAKGEDGDRSFEWSQKTENGAFSEFGGEEPSGRLGDAEMFKNTHSHLFHVAGSKDSCGDNALRVSAGAKTPGLDGASFNENDRSKALKIFR
jgi:hypothetical protein